MAIGVTIYRQSQSYYLHEVTLKVWAKSKLVEFLPNWGGFLPSLPEIKFWMIGGKIFHIQSQSFFGVRLPWKFEPNLSLLIFLLIWGAPPFCLKSSFVLKSCLGWGGGEGVNFSTSNHNNLLAWNYPESLNQIWIGCILPDSGCPPPHFFY